MLKKLILCLVCICQCLLGRVQNQSNGKTTSAFRIHQFNHVRSIPFWTYCRSNHHSCRPRHLYYQYSHTRFRGANMFLWNRYKVNYIFIFEFDPRKHTRYSNIGETAGFMTVLLLLSLTFYLVCTGGAPGFVSAVGVPPQIFPLIMLVLQLVFFVIVQFKTKFWLLKTLGRIVCAPFFFVLFKDFILADQLTSIAIVLFDLEFTLCFYSYDAWSGTSYCLDANQWIRPCIAFLPGLWRLLQSFRRYRDHRERVHLYNAGKYSTGLIVSSLSFVRYPNYKKKFLIFLEFMIKDLFL